MATIKEYFKEVGSLESEIDDYLDELVVSTTRLIETSRRDKGLSQNAVDMGIAVFVGIFFSKYNKALIDRNTEIARIGSEIDYVKVEKLLSKTGNQSLLTKLQREIKKYQEHASKAIWSRIHPLDGRSLPEKLAWIEQGSVKTMRNIIAVDVEKGKSVAEMAKDIEMYIKPETKKGYVGPYDYARQRFAKIKLKDINKIPAGSVSYNAHLIARTESHLTYRNAVIDVYKDKSYIKGWTWHLSNSHPIADICDDWAAASPYIDPIDIPIDHPNGLCYITADVMDKAEFERYMDTL